MSKTFLTKIETCPTEKIYFQTEEIEIGNFPSDTEWGIINVFDDVVYQEVLGFGGAFTESAAYNYSLLSEEEKKRFLELYFDREKGIGYNFGRSHINSCDFSLDVYTSVEEGDMTLETFNLSREKKYILPFLKDALAYCKEEIVLFASPWSPPAYMKENGSMKHGTRVLEEYKTVWARYYAKYIKAMAEEGVHFSAITVQNEPKAAQPWESCCYSPEEEAEFIDKYLIPVLDEEGLSDIKIMIWDHNKERVYDRAKKILSIPKVNERVWAVSHHWYSGDHFEGLRLVYEQLKKNVICGEFCGPITADVNVLAENYGIEMCENLNNYETASCDWNLLLDQDGGPYHDRNYNEEESGREDKSLGCYAPIIYDTESKKLVVTPIYYYIGHFSKFVKRGAKRIATTKYCRDLYACAFVNPDGEKVCIVINSADRVWHANLRYNDTCTEILMKPHSIITLLF